MQCTGQELCKQTTLMELQPKHQSSLLGDGKGDIITLYDYPMLSDLIAIMKIWTIRSLGILMS